jgi:endonuclease-8
VAVIEVPNAVAVCFDAPTVELMDTRALAIHPALSSLGPDLLASEPDLAEAVRRLGEPARAQVPIGEALLDQTVMAGLGNVYRTELLWEVLVSPFAPLGEVSESVKRRLVETGAAMLRANLNGHARVTTTDALGGPPGSLGPRRGTRNLNVYGRAGRPCPRCGTSIKTKVSGDLPRRVFWCPTCQA